MSINSDIWRKMLHTIVYLKDMHTLVSWIITVKFTKKQFEQQQFDRPSLLLTKLHISIEKEKQRHAPVVWSNVTSGPHSPVGSVSSYRSRGCEFDYGPVPYFHGD